MDYLVLDLYGGTTEFHGTRHQAEKACRNIIRRYREQAREGQLLPTDYPAEILVLKVVSRNALRTARLVLVKG